MTSRAEKWAIMRANLDDQRNTDIQEREGCSVSAID
jgi:hypothetical protein